MATRNFTDAEKTGVANALYNTLKNKGCRKKISPSEIYDFFKGGALRNVLGYTKKYNWDLKNPPHELQDTIWYNLKKDKKDEISKYIASKPKNIFSFFSKPKTAEKERISVKGLEGRIGGVELKKILEGITKHVGIEMPYNTARLEKENGILINLYTELLEKYDELKGKYQKNRGGILGFFKQPYEVTKVGKIISVYKQKIMEKFTEVYNKLEALEEKYAGKELGFVAKHKLKRDYKEAKRDIIRDLKEAIKYKPAAVAASVLLIASFLLLGFSAGHMTGFVIASNEIPSGYPIAAGFILLAIALCISLMRRKRKKGQGRKIRKRNRKIRK